MGQSREHPGHRAEAMLRIQRAYEHYNSRSERRLKQVFDKETKTWSRSDEEVR